MSTASPRLSTRARVAILTVPFPGWPKGVALVSEAWAKVARPIVASLIGMAGYLGILAMSTLATVGMVLVPLMPDTSERDMKR